MIKEVKIIEWTLDKDKLDEIVNEVETEVKEKLEKEKKPSEEKMTEKGEEMTEKVVQQVLARRASSNSIKVAFFIDYCFAF